MPRIHGALSNPRRDPRACGLGHGTCKDVTSCPQPPDKRQASTSGSNVSVLTRSQLVQSTQSGVSPVRRALSKSTTSVVRVWSAGATALLCDSGQSSGSSGRSTGMKIQLGPFSEQLPDLALHESKPLSKNLSLLSPLSCSFILSFPFIVILGFFLMLWFVWFLAVPF